MKILRFGMVLLLSVTLWGCGKGNSNAPVTIDPATGKHPVGMAVAGTGGIHVDAYFASPSGCEGCHGKPEDLSGGIVKVSCSTNSRSGMTCHAGKFPHGVGFEVPATHGTKRAIIAAGPTSGMAFCAKCHGAAFTGGTGSRGVGCIGCHQTQGSNAPHAGNWAAYLNNARGLNHSSTHESNAAVCAQCHANKKNLSPAGVTQVAIFTTKGVGGCFDNTMCHNQARHALPYTSRATHGAEASRSMGSCLSSACHSNGASPLRLNRRPANNVNMPNGCETCHIGSLPSPVFGVGTVGLGLAHPPLWLQSRGTATNHSDATFGAGGSYCNPCHALTGLANGPSAPSCGTASVIGATVCHSSSSNPVTNPTGCASCHGNPPSTSKHPFHLPPTIPLLDCTACHGTLAGPGNPLHSNNVLNTGFNNTLFGEGTGITFIGNVCSNVSCHGGNPINWVTDTIDLTTGADCLRCHTVVNTDGNVGGQYINVYNGDNTAGLSIPNQSNLNLHVVHIQFLACTDCHGTTELQTKHFTELYKGQRLFVLGDPQAKQFAASTITATGLITSYPGGPLGSCNSVCHTTGAKNWFK